VHSEVLQCVNVFVNEVNRPTQKKLSSIKISRPNGSRKMGQSMDPPLEERRRNVE